MICWCNIGGGGRETDGLAMYSPGTGSTAHKNGREFHRGCTNHQGGHKAPQKWAGTRHRPYAVADDWCEKHCLQPHKKNGADTRPAVVLLSTPLPFLNLFFYILLIVSLALNLIGNTNLLLTGLPLRVAGLQFGMLSTTRTTSLSKRESTD